MTDLTEEHCKIETRMQSVRYEMFQRPARKHMSSIQWATNGGTLSRQGGEPRTEHVDICTRWWLLLQELDPYCEISPSVRGELFLEQSGRSRTEKRSIRSSTQNNPDDKAITEALVKQHSKLH